MPNQTLTVAQNIRRAPSSRAINPIWYTILRSMVSVPQGAPSKFYTELRQIENFLWNSNEQNIRMIKKYTKASNGLCLAQ